MWKVDFSAKRFATDLCTKIPPTVETPTPLNEKSRFWMDVRILSSDGKPADKIPMKNGYFEVALPKVLFDGNPKSVTLNWIDFNRG